MCNVFYIILRQRQEPTPRTASIFVKIDTMSSYKHLHVQTYSMSKYTPSLCRVMLEYYSWYSLFVQHMRCLFNVKVDKMSLILYCISLLYLSCVFLISCWFSLRIFIHIGISICQTSIHRKNITNRHSNFDSSYPPIW